MNKLTISCPSLSCAQVIEELFSKLSSATSFVENEQKQVWQLGIYLKHTASLNDIEASTFAVRQAYGDDIKIKFEKLDDIDWVKQNQKSFIPLVIGDFFVYQSSYKALPEKGKIPILIEATKAFGTGNHATTSGCLHAICDLGNSHNFKNIIDIGTGTAILAIGLSKVFKDSKIIATDNDPQALEVAINSIDQNGCKNIEVKFADGILDANLKLNPPYDLVVANILYKPLLTLASSVSKNQQEGGYFIISGIFKTHQEKIENHYKKFDYEIYKCYPQGQWQTIIFIKQSELFK